MTPQDLRAEGLVGPALQACLVKLADGLEADPEAEDLAATLVLLQHFMPSQKHLTTLQHHVQVAMAGFLIVFWHMACLLQQYVQALLLSISC